MLAAGWPLALQVGWIWIALRKWHMAKTYKPGETAPRSGEYEIVGPRGGSTGKERTVARGEALPPTPKAGQAYVIHRPAHGLVTTKSGRVIIPSPAKSANTIDSWSKAFSRSKTFKK
jgi:hypothetical protein